MVTFDFVGLVDLCGFGGCRLGDRSGGGERGWCNAGEIGVASVGVGEVGVRFIVEDMVIVVEVGPT